MVSSVDSYSDGSVCRFNVSVTKESEDGKIEVKDSSDNPVLEIPVVGTNGDELFGKLLYVINREIHPGSRTTAEQLFG